MQLLFLVFVFFPLVQNIGARPNPEDSATSSGWSSWFTSSTPRDYGEYTSRNPRSLTSSDISVERADLLSQGTTLANQVLELVAIVPGLESISNYGKESLKMAENAMEAVNTFQENFVQNLSNLGSQFSMIAYGRETIKSWLDAVVGIIEQAIKGIENLSSAGDNILSSLHVTRSHLGTVQGTLNNYL
uniref:Salivary protein MYS n=1 Tax=Triatoma matogrossensis TaxID=162370 RepID=E2J780_9HEMI